MSYFIFLYVIVQIGLTHALSSFSSIEALILSHGYPVETHYNITSDGYILKMHRIPPKQENNGKVAFLVHGLLCSSADFVITGPGNSLAYLLHDEGYDVWILNTRGNTQSRNHIRLTEGNSKFWDFSWYEKGIYDVPEMIDFVLRATGKTQIYYIGYSEGTTNLFVMASERPEYNSKIKVAIHLAPVAYMKNMVSPVLRFLTNFQLLGMALGNFNVLKNDGIFVEAAKLSICSTKNVELCKNLAFVIFGFNPDKMNDTLVPWITQWTPAGSSTKEFIHYAQLVQSGKFRKYDYILTNLLKYGKTYPPSFDLSKVNSPNYLFWSDNDWVSAENDVKRLCTEIGSACKGLVSFSSENYNHLDYLYAINVSSVVYSHILDIFNLY